MAVCTTLEKLLAVFTHNICDLLKNLVFHTWRSRLKIIIFRVYNRTVLAEKRRDQNTALFRMFRP